jgi:hypothetical protein
MVAKKIIKIAKSGVDDPAQISALAIKELEMRQNRRRSHLAVWNRNLSNPRAFHDGASQDARQS